LESVLAQERINIFDRTVTNPRPREAAPDSDIDRVSRSFQREFANETLQGQTLVYFVLFLVVAALIIAGFIGWQVWRQKRMEKELSDPIFLVYELNVAHQLSEPEKRLMQELSEKHSLATSLNLFIEPKYLLDALDNETFASSRPEVQQLLYKLFDVTKA